jgi:hypothetical protein
MAPDLRLLDDRHPDAFDAIDLGRLASEGRVFGQSEFSKELARAAACARTVQTETDQALIEDTAGCVLILQDLDLKATAASRHIRPPKVGSCALKLIEEHDLDLFESTKIQRLAIT